jgi:hypothetical protein
MGKHRMRILAFLYAILFVVVTATYAQQPVTGVHVTAPPPTDLTTVINPTSISFTASPDHDVLVDHYELEVMAGSETGALAFTVGLGKPAPNGQGTIAASVAEFLFMPTDTLYVATVTAVGVGAGANDFATSAPSNAFERIGSAGEPLAVGDWLVDSSCAQNGTGQPTTTQIAAADYCASSGGAAGATTNLQTALSGVTAGQTVWIKTGAGTYVTSNGTGYATETGFHLAHDGLPSHPITIRAYPTNTPVLDACADGSTQLSDCNRATLSLYNHCNVHVTGFTVRGLLFVYGNSSGVANLCDGVQIDHMEVTRGYAPAGADNWSGIWLYGVTGAHVHHNYIHNLAALTGYGDDPAACMTVNTGIMSLFEYNTCIPNGVTNWAFDDQQDAINNVWRYNYAEMTFAANTNGAMRIQTRASDMANANACAYNWYVHNNLFVSSGGNVADGIHFDQGCFDGPINIYNNTFVGFQELFQQVPVDVGNYANNIHLWNNAASGMATTNTLSNQSTPSTTAQIRSVAKTAWDTRATLTLNKPNGTVNGDILIAVVSLEESGSTNTITGPNGWKRELSFSDSGHAVRHSLWSKQASNEGASWNWTFNSARSGGFVIAVEGGWVAGMQLPWVDAIGTGNANASPNQPMTASSITPTGTSSLLIYTGVDVGVASHTAPTGMSDPNGDLNNGENFGFIQSLTSAGATGTRTPGTNAAGVSASVLIAIRSSTAPLTSDYNAWTTGKNWRINDIVYSTFADLQAAGYDTHSPTPPADFGFTTGGTDSFAYHLTAGSPLKNAGRVGGVPSGAVTDIGAYGDGVTCVGYTCP